MYVDIAFSLNRALQVPLLVVMNSILHNVRPQRDQRDWPLRFNVLVPQGDRIFFEQQIQAAFAEYEADTVVFRVREFVPPTYLEQYLDNKFHEKKAERRFSRHMQFGRLFLKEVFPDLRRVIYLDGDTVVLGDVRSLFAEGSRLNSHHYLAAVPQLFPTIFYFSNPFKLWSELKRFRRSFNSGVLITDLSFWTEQVCDLRRHYLDLDAKNRYRLFRMPDEAILNLMVRDTYLPLAKCWNYCGYGQSRLVAALLKRDLRQISVIHWSGGLHKPWECGKNPQTENQVAYADIWRSYVPLAIRQSSVSSVVQPKNVIQLKN